jgi:prepilin signal peptidase PulO-like enzyme (type II secretory pathway)
MDTTERRLRGDGQRRVWTLALAGPVVLLAVDLLAWRGPGPAHPSVGQAVALVMVAVAAVTDGRWGKIYNWCTYPAVAWGLVLALLGASHAGLAVRLGAVGPVDALAGLAACFVGMLVVQDLTGSGMGDVKLGAALGCLLGLEGALEALLLGFALAGVVAIAGCVAHHGVLVTVGAFAKSYAGVLLPGSARPVLSGRERALLDRRIRLGPYLAAGTALAIAGAGNLLL